MTRFFIVLRHNTVMVATADVIVVGAGPAGATAARALATAGVNTILLDKARFPRQKPCGGAITTRALLRFPYLRSVLDGLSTHWISNLHLESPGGEVLEFRSADPAVVLIRRLEFDSALVASARMAGAEVIQGADINRAAQDDNWVSVETRDGRSFRGRFAIAADGVHSALARRLGIMNGWNRAALAIDMMEETPSSTLRACEPNSLWVSYGFAPSDRRNPAQPSAGYGYVFPKPGFVNVGVGYLVTDFRGAAHGNAYSVQRDFVEYLCRRNVLKGSSVREHFTPFLIPIAGPLRKPARGRVLVAGDAAGFVNGATAEGIYYAMVSGDIAAHALIGALSDARSHRAEYRTRWRKEIGVELRDSVAVQRFLLSDRRRIDSVVQGGRDRPASTEGVVRWLSGIEAYEDARRFILGRNPVAALHLIGLVLLGTLRGRIGWSEDRGRLWAKTSN